jgi:hypothetical protein
MATRQQADDRRQAGDVIRKLAGVRNSSIAFGVLTAVLAGLVMAGLAWLVLSLLDIGLGLGGLPLRVIGGLTFLSALGILAFYLIKVFRISHSIRSYAARVGTELKEIGLDLVSLLDLAEIDNRKFGYSEVLISRAIGRIAEQVKHFDLEAAVRKRAAYLYAIPLAAIVAGGFAWRHYDGASFDYSAARLRYLWGLSRDSAIAITVAPGDKELLAGSDLEVSAEVKGFVRKVPSLHVLSDGEERSYEMERAEAPKQAPFAGVGGTVRGRRRYTRTLPRLDRDVGYFVTLGDKSTRILRVSVKEEPRISAGTITLLYPAYTQLGREVLPQGNWDITAPYGTEAIFGLAANCVPEKAWMTMIGAGGRTWDEPMRIAADSLAAAVRLVEDFSYTFEFAAAESLRAKPHGPHAVTVVSDKPPFVRIESPAREILLEADMVIPLSVVALDDYGISSMKLSYESKGGKGEMTLPYHGKTQAKCDYTWDISGLDVFPGDAVSYYVTVADNDALTGPKFAKTDVYIARVPTVYDLYEDIESQQDQEMTGLEEVEDRAKELRNDLEKLGDDMKKDAGNDASKGWEQEQAIKQNLAGQEDVAKRLEEMSASLDQTLDAMSQSSLVNFDVIAKMEEIRQLLDEVATQDMKNALEKMREAMANLSPEEIKAAMQNMDITQEDLLRKLDKTIAMLKRLQLQQKLDAAQNLAASIAEGQKEVNQDLQGKQNLAGSEAKEKQLAKDASALRDMIKKLEDLMKAQGNPLAGDVGKAGELMDSKGVQSAMASMLSQMAGGKTSDALSEGERLQPNLEELASMLKAASEALNNNEKQEAMKYLTETMNGLRDISGRQQGVVSALEDSSRAVSRSELARQEIGYKEALDRIAEKVFEGSTKSLFISPMLGRAILKIGAQVEAASQDLAQGPGREAGQTIKASVGSMNQMVTGLMDAMDKASSCSSPGGMCDAFDNLESMCSMQLGINESTQQMMGESDQGDQGLSMQARSQMAKLAAQQQLVKQGIEDLSGQYGSRADVLGRLDDLAEEAKRVISDLNKGTVDEETLKRQEQILTRMLDAQKSLRKREYSQRRKSRPGETIEVASPPPLSLEERERVVRDLLYRGRGYYPPEYEQLIRAYFKAIAAAQVKPR